VPFLRLPDLFFRDVVFLAELADKSVRIGFRPLVDLPQPGIELSFSGLGLLGKGRAVDEKGQEDEACRCGQDLFYFKLLFSLGLSLPRAYL